MWQTILNTLPFVAYGLLAFICVVAILIGILCAALWIDEQKATPSEDNDWWPL